MEEPQKCQLAVCQCYTSAEHPYCSEYCRQAATQAIPRDFCQCAHAGCEQSALSPPAELRLEAPGTLTLEYASVEDLRHQLRRLAQALDLLPAKRPIPAAAGARVPPGRAQSVRRRRRGRPVLARRGAHPREEADPKGESNDPFSIPRCEAVEQTVRLEKEISAMELEPGEHGTVKLGRITALPSGMQLDLCGVGFNERTVRVRADGHYYFVFWQDLEAPKTFSAAGV